MDELTTSPTERSLGNLGALLGPTVSAPRIRPAEPSRDDEDFACLNCHDAGFVRLKERTILGAKDFGRAVPCEKCAGVVVAMGIPGYLQQASFQNFNVSRNPKMAAAVKAVREVAEGRSWSCLLMGDYGVGKTHLAVAALRFNKLPKPGRFWQVGDLLRLFRERMFTSNPSLHADEDELITPYLHLAGLLVLDDIGAGTPESSFTERVLYTIVNHRYTERLPTILTSNDVVDDRILSRCRPNAVTCEGEDLRERL